MVSEVRRALNQVMAGQVRPFLRDHGFEDRKKGCFLRVVDGVGVDSLWFQNSSYPGCAPYYINIDAATDRWIAYRGGIEHGLGQLSGRVHPPPEFAFAPGADMWMLRTVESAAEHGAGLCRTLDETVFPQLDTYLRYNMAIEDVAGDGTPSRELPPQWRGVVNRMMYPQHLDDYFAWIRAGQSPEP
ncbi:hypothetical protein Dvina_16725 [Dactylosporangium vinaceum]|uniref:DUF4304 domain-containing protein n=1 Tax=Dactylosporangium vinaceum TaxID=53362 RepID=A0ABV5M8R7_9ACTN|nr:DUF4304 domain-containing protein [Dactylosporangium vinaceum]UAB99566.1 hypothetical protein Dvina_16725 [Dactylosporangium vinaceum]